MRTEIDGIQVHCRYDEIRELDTLTEHPQNANRHPQYQLERLAEIIEATGWRQPITISAASGYIVKGHGRYRAAMLAGWKRAPIEIQSYETPEQELADLIADNHMAELAELDKAALAATLQELADDPEELALTGYTQTDIDALLAEAATFYCNKKVASIRATGQKNYENILNYIEARNNDGVCKLNRSTYSSELCEKLLHIYGTEGMTVFDPFAGTGTTGVAAERLDMSFIGSEISAAQCDYAAERIDAIVEKSTY